MTEGDLQSPVMFLEMNGMILIQRALDKTGIKDLCCLKYTSRDMASI